MDRQKAEEIVDRILVDLTSRRGFRHLWDACDREIKQEIRERWVQIATGEIDTEKEKRERFLDALYKNS